MSRAAFVAIVIVALSLAACETTPTPYQPLAAGNAVSGGYSEQQLDDTHYRVTFKGNDMTSRTQVETYLLYRAAELAVVKGGDWFEMVDKHTHNDGHVFIDPEYGPGWGYWRPDWTFFDRPGFAPWGGVHWDPYSVERFDAYQATAVIALGRGAKPANDTRAFGARQVIENLGPKIVRPH
jgi:hypothetical protein